MNEKTLKTIEISDFQEVRISQYIYKDKLYIDVRKFYREAKIESRPSSRKRRKREREGEKK